MNYQIGVWGTDTQTEFILVDSGGTIRDRKTRIGCNPDAHLDQDTIRWVLIEALDTLGRQAEDGTVTRTALCLPGSPEFWVGIAARLHTFSPITTHADCEPALELATQGKPGILLDCGSLSARVAARGTDLKVYQAGNLGPRLGDPGSDYDLGCRALKRTLAELQGWAESSALGEAVCAALKSRDPVVLPVKLNGPSISPQQVAALGESAVEQAASGDAVAAALVSDAVGELANRAATMRTRLFGDPADVVIGLRGFILRTNPAVEVLRLALGTRTNFVTVNEDVTEGLRHILAHT